MGFWNSCGVQFTKTFNLNLLFLKLSIKKLKQEKVIDVCVGLLYVWARVCGFVFAWACMVACGSACVCGLLCVWECMRCGVCVEELVGVWVCVSTQSKNESFPI